MKGRRCAPHYTLHTRVHTFSFTPKAQQGGSLAIHTCDDLGPFPNRGGRSPSKRAAIMASAGGEEGHTTRTYFTIHFDPALPHACSRGGVWVRGFLGVCVSAGRFGSARVRTLTFDLTKDVTGEMRYARSFTLLRLAFVFTVADLTHAVTHIGSGVAMLSVTTDTTTSVSRLGLLTKVLT